MGKRITNSLVAKLAPSDRTHFSWDRDLKGFGLKITPSGRKTYVAQFRLGGRGSTTKRYTIGVDGSPWTAKTARAEAERILHLAGLGEDPTRVASEKNHELNELRFDRYVDAFLETYASTNWAPRTYSTHESNLRRWVIPVLRSASISALRRKDITKVLDHLPAGKPALPRNVFVLMRTIFNWAIERGDLEVSPVNGMRVPKSAPDRHHILSDTELLVVAALAADLGSVWGDFLHLLIITGQRRSEVAESNWAEFDRDAAVWTIPGARTKNSREHTVPLNKASVAVLDEIAEGRVWPQSGYLFSHVEGKPISGFSRMKRRFDAMLKENSGSEIRPWRLHDLRRTVATNMQRLGVRFEVTEALLNHVSITQTGVASVYHRHDWAQEKRDAMDKWGERLLEILDQYRTAKASD